MDNLPRSCCDPGDKIDITQVDFNAFRSIYSFLSDLVSLLIVTFTAFHGRASSRIALSTPTVVMDEYVDHLRLPASQHIGLDFFDPHFWWASFFIVFNPVFWNVAARLEHKTKILTRLCFGQPKIACALLGLVIVLLGLWRDHLFNLACHTQPSWILLRQNRVLILGYLSCLIGTVFVVTSFYQLGFYATFLGDYFGIFPHSSLVTSFPFSVHDDPMYLGSFLNFFGLALVKSSPAGVLLALIVGVVYKAALLFETPFVKSVYEAHSKRMNEEPQDDDGDGEGEDDDRRHDKEE